MSSQKTADVHLHSWQYFPVLKIKHIILDSCQSKILKLYNKSLTNQSFSVRMARYLPFFKVVIVVNVYHSNINNNLFLTVDICQDIRYLPVNIIFNHQYPLTILDHHYIPNCKQYLWSSKIWKLTSCCIERRAIPTWKILLDK